MTNWEFFTCIQPRDLYILHDYHDTLKAKGAIKVSEEQANSANKDGWGVFWTVQQFSDLRKIANLKKIHAWAVDIDTKNKSQTLEIIMRGLKPSLIVETPGGFHVYFNAIDATADNYRSILEDRLIPFYNADPNAKDLSRILRVPEYLHWKNRDAPTLVKVIYECEIAYTEKNIQDYYPARREKFKPYEKSPAKIKNNYCGSNVWDAVGQIDCAEALERISGHEFVNREVFTLRNNPNGTKNILVDGKSTSCWIDKNGRIGSSDKGGPTIAQWLNWYKKDYSSVIRLLREVFPELPSD